MESVEAPVGLAVHGTMVRAKICALLVALSKLIGHRPRIHSDSRGVVQALNRGEVECINANHEDADLWIKVWVKVDGHKEQHLRLRVVVGQGAQFSQGRGADGAAKIRKLQWRQ